MKKKDFVTFDKRYRKIYIFQITVHLGTLFTIFVFSHQR